jgi:hypothetical protein
LQTEGLGLKSVKRPFGEALEHVEKIEVRWNRKL